MVKNPETQGKSHRGITVKLLAKDSARGAQRRDGQLMGQLERHYLRGEVATFIGHLLDALDPVLLLLRRRGRDAVHRVVPLHHSPVSLRLTGLNHLVFVVGDVKLKAVLRIKKERE